MIVLCSENLSVCLYGAFISIAKNIQNIQFNPNLGSGGGGGVILHPLPVDFPLIT